MIYDLQKCGNTGNWWIMSQDEKGCRKIERTLSADLTVVQAWSYLNKYMENINNA
jgi:lipopolysaccharide/colanic/teichoic acid biosynthesis glycosyltransferase